jgi:hypothetical protein
MTITFQYMDPSSKILQEKTLYKDVLTKKVNKDLQHLTNISKIMAVALIIFSFLQTLACWFLPFLLVPATCTFGLAIACEDVDHSPSNYFSRLPHPRELNALLVESTDSIMINSQSTWQYLMECHQKP